MVLGFDKRYLWGVLPFLGMAIGHYLDVQETQRMTRFRDKSALYGRPDGDNRPPSW